MARSRTIRRSRKRKYGSSVSFLPDLVQAFVARRLVDLLALSLIGVGLFITVSLITYDRADPSWNTATTAGQQIQNWGGWYGAWAGDILLQTLGGGAFVLAAGFAFWGFRIFRRETIRPLMLRIASLLAATLLASVAMAQIPSGQWTVHPYLGSSAGTLILNKIVGLSHSLHIPHGHHVLASLCGVFAALIFVYTAACTRYEMAYFWFRTKLAVYTVCGAIAAASQSFYGWVMHYNGADYEPAERPGFMERVREMRDRWSSSAEEDEEESDEDEDEDDEESAEDDDEESDEDEEESDEYDEDEDEESDDEEEDDEPAPPRRKLGIIPVTKPQKTKTTKTNTQQSLAFMKKDGEWELPSIALIDDAPADAVATTPKEDALRRNAELLQNVLADFNVKGFIREIKPGPVITLYELEPAPGTKTSRVVSLSDDIARSMSAISVRCAALPGRNAIGIELPNKHRQIVYMKEMLQSKDYQKTQHKLPLILGKDIGGSPIMADLSTMPHLLIAGTTGSGKSVAVNTMIMSLLYRLSPEQCRFIMIDPKMLELSVYNDIPHLLSPVVTEPGKAIVALKWAVREMENRNHMMSKLSVRNIDNFNQRIRDAIKKGEQIIQKVQTGFDPDSGKPVFEDRPLDLVELPYIVVIVDEFADLMLTAGKDVENAIQRLAQMARAAGIHLIMATQRPSVDVVTGVIKANFPRRISFHVTSKIDSRTILGESGAEQLLGKGDMLYMVPGARIMRVHAPKLEDHEVSRIVGFIKSQGKPSYIDNLTEDSEGGDGDLFGGEGGSEVDELYDKAVAVIAREGKVSTSFIQRHLQIGYNRAARIIEEMERQGVISKANGTGKREILISDYSDV
jgi:S-DNA-T family DNA segregation ATPase FtsK/SpoIIIE